MLAYKLTAEIGEDRRLVLDAPDGIPPGYVDVLLLVPQSDDEIPVVDDPEDLKAFREAKEEPGENVAWEDVKAELDL